MEPKEQFDKVLELFRLAEKYNRKVVTAIERDEALCQLVETWSPNLVRFIGTDQEEPEDESEKWEWLWSQVKIDEDGLHDMVSAPLIMNLLPKIKQAIALRVIYPDGSINKDMEAVIRFWLTQMLRKKKTGS